MSQARPSRHYRLVHRATYTYPEPVASSYGRAVLLPREGFGQVPRAAALSVTPAPAEQADFLDIAGNRATYFHVTRPHTILEARAESVVSVTRRRVDVERVPQVPWEQAVAAVRRMRAGGKGPHGEGPATVLGIVDAALPSELADPDAAVLGYALPSFRPGTPLVAALADLAHRIRSDVGYAAGALPAPAPAAEVLTRGSGAGHDLAHLLCACLRSLGLAARFVSGYLDAAPAGRKRLQGTDGPHAWAAAWLPGGGWLHVDPTNDQFLDDRYVVLGWGRDLRDVSPLRGVALTPGAGSTLAVDVGLVEIGEDEALSAAVGATGDAAAAPVAERR